MQKRASGDFKDNYIKHLLNYKWFGDVWAVPEGTIIFPNEPAVQVTGSSIHSRWFETYILQQMNTQSIIATKASRMFNVAKGKNVIDFGARRAKNPLLAARASFIGGAIGNLIDRLHMRQVIDFIEVGVKKFRWPVFNFADSFVTIGIVIIIWVWIFGRKRTDSNKISLTKSDNLI